MATAMDAIRTAERYIGWSGARCSLFWDYVFGSGYADGDSTPYCACFASYVLGTNGVRCAGMPSGSTTAIYRAAKAAGRTFSEPEPGDVVLFDWGRDGTPYDHTGFVTGTDDDGSGRFWTVEGNLDGGQVERVHRSRRYVACFVRPYYDGDQVQAGGERQPDDAIAGGYYVVTVDSLAVMDAPDSGAARVGQRSRGQVVSLGTGFWESGGDGWARLSDGSGYMDMGPLTGSENSAGDYLVQASDVAGTPDDDIEAGTYLVQADSAAIRAQPSKGSAQVGTLSKGQYVLLDDAFWIREGDGWGRVSGTTTYVDLGPYTGSEDSSHDYLVRRDEPAQAEEVSADDVRAMRDEVVRQAVAEIERRLSGGGE